MKIKKSELKRIIQEEIGSLREEEDPFAARAGSFSQEAGSAALNNFAQASDAVVAAINEFLADPVVRKWAQHGAAGAAAFMDRGEQLASLLTRNIDTLKSTGKPLGTSQAANEQRLSLNATGDIIEETQAYDAFRAKTIELFKALQSLMESSAVPRVRGIMGSGAGGWHNLAQRGASGQAFNRQRSYSNQPAGDTEYMSIKLAAVLVEWAAQLDRFIGSNTEGDLKSDYGPGGLPRVVPAHGASPKTARLPYEDPSVTRTSQRKTYSSGFPSSRGMFGESTLQEMIQEELEAVLAERIKQ